MFEIWMIPHGKTEYQPLKYESGERYILESEERAQECIATITGFMNMFSHAPDAWDIRKVEDEC